MSLSFGRPLRRLRTLPRLRENLNCGCLNPVIAYMRALIREFLDKRNLNLLFLRRLKRPILRRVNRKTADLRAKKAILFRQ